MLRISLKQSLATVAVAAAVAVPAAYQQPQTDLEFLAAVSDGTSNTIMFEERAGRFSIDIGTSENIAADGREL